MYRVVIDPKICSGTSNCVEDAPSAFEVGDDGIARVIDLSDPEALLRGAQACPVEAIRLFDASGTRVYP